MNEGSIHTGVVKNAGDKGCDIFFETFGVEGFCPSRHMTKEDGSRLVNDETAQFVVIEFDRNEKRIVLSHTRIWEQAKVEEVEAEKKEAKVQADQTKKAVKAVQAKVEKSTLGDIDALMELKAKMEKSEKK